MGRSKSIVLPANYNYVGVFLTLGCNLACSYCINHLSGLNPKRKHLNANEWISFLNRLELKPGLPLSLQGGEPSIHPGFYEILNSLRPDLEIDLLTNLQFDPLKFMSAVKPERFHRPAPYASIRVSYHPETMKLKPLLEKAFILKSEGYPIAIYTVDHPAYKTELKEAQELSQEKGLEFKTKELLGRYEETLHGLYKYPDSVDSNILKSCECKTSELLISPEGQVFRCHHDLYNLKFPIGDMLNPEFQIEDIYRPCHFYGNCNPCDVKIKNNRYQEFGHTSVDIKNIREREVEEV